VDRNIILYIFVFTEGEQDECMLSNNSIQPEWRSNYRSDYKGTTRPVCTRDLLCWAFQVARGMDYLASRKVRMSSYHTCFKKVSAMLPLACGFVTLCMVVDVC
jgi:hypothetical protein